MFHTMALHTPSLYHIISVLYCNRLCMYWKETFSELIVHIAAIPAKIQTANYFHFNDHFSSQFFLLVPEENLWNKWHRFYMI